MSHLRAPAKINLGLKVMGVREDGYHFLESLFAPVTLYDEISINRDTTGQKGDRVTFIINGQTQIIANDTVSRALAFCREIAPTCPFFNVVIQKAIPVGAGLGGGSSDAGTVLRFVSQTVTPPLENAVVEQLALKIGADVPFFLNPQPAWVTGIGENVEPIDLEPLTVLICKPDFSISTPEAFSWYDHDSPQLTPQHTDATSMGGTEVSERHGQLQNKTMTVQQVMKFLENDLEKPVETRHPEIQEMRLALRQWGALGSLMSGTGSSVYGLFRNNAEAVAAREKLKPRYPSTYSFFICETVRREN